MGGMLKRRLAFDGVSRPRLSRDLSRETRMLRPRKTIDAAATAARLDGLQAAVRSEEEGVEMDPFDDAMVTAVLGAAEALETGTVTLAEIEARVEKLARRPVSAK